MYQSVSSNGYPWMTKFTCRRSVVGSTTRTKKLVREGGQEKNTHIIPKVIRYASSRRVFRVDDSLAASCYERGAGLHENIVAKVDKNLLLIS